MTCGIRQRDSKIARNVPSTVREYDFAGMVAEDMGQGERLVGGWVATGPRGVLAARP